MVPYVNMANIWDNVYTCSQDNHKFNFSFTTVFSGWLQTGQQY